MNSGIKPNGIYGANIGGKLNDANIVKPSRRTKRPSVAGGTRAAEDEPNILAKLESFHTLRETLAADVPANLALPCVTDVQGEGLTVEENVSIELAVI
jgi:hypothetical protein